MFPSRKIIKDHHLMHDKPLKTHDINLPSLQPGYFQHIGKKPNSNKVIRKWESKLKKESVQIESVDEEKQRLLREKIVSENDRKAEKMLIRKKIQDRVKEKIKAYKDKIDDRRARLSEFLFQEEKHAYNATIDLAQKSENHKLEEMRQRAEEIKDKRACKQQKLLEVKRLQQYSQRCHDLREVISKRILEDSKKAQLIQIKENEMKREYEKEVEEMWNDVVMKEVQEKEEREILELIRSKEREQDLVKTWEKQVQGKKLVEAELARLQKEDFKEIERINADIGEKLENVTDVAKQKKLLYKEELKKQMELNKLIVDQRKKEEDQFNKKMHELALKEQEKEENLRSDLQHQIKEETKLYRSYLRDMAAQKKADETTFNESLRQFQDLIQKQNDDKYCKSWREKEKLKRDVQEFRDRQIKIKQDLLDEEKEERQVEDEVAKQMFNTNMCLQNEYLRQNKEAKYKYRDDLLQQIEYNKLLKQREKEEVERMYNISLEEEAQYQKKIEELTSNVNIGQKHKFRSLLENPCCYCPTKN